MLVKKISMPHPVLGITGDMKTGSFDFFCTIKLDSTLRQYRIGEVHIEVTNPYIKWLYEEKKIDFVLKISCAPTYKTWTFVNPKEAHIPENEVDILIEVESYLVAVDNIEDYIHTSFSDDFEDRPFSLAKGDIVGLTGSKKIPIRKENEKVSLGSIFRFAKINSDSKSQELHFDFDEDQIAIHYPSINPDYDPITLLFDKIQGLPYTALNLYIVPALTDAFRLLQNADEGNYAEKKWALVLESLLPKSEWDEDSFITAQRVLKMGLPINMAFDEIIKSKNLVA